MKIDLTITASTKAADFTKQERIEIKPKSTQIIGLILPNTFKGRIARWLGLPSFVTVEVSPAKRGRPSGKN